MENLMKLEACNWDEGQDGSFLFEFLEIRYKFGFTIFELAQIILNFDFQSNFGKKSR